MKEVEANSVLPCGRRLLVLVVEQDEGVRTLVQFALEQEDFDIRLATDGAQALELYRVIHRDVDVVLLDLGMQGMPGATTLAAMQAINPAMRCCFMTGGVLLINALETKVFAKPFSIPSLVASLRDLAVQGRKDRMEKFPC